MDSADDMSPAAQQVIATALRAIKEALFALGAEGDECIQRLVSAQATLGPNDPQAAAAILRAFIAGLNAEGVPGGALPPLRVIHDIACKAALLNEASRRDGRRNIGPFDMPEVQEALRRAGQV